MNKAVLASVWSLLLACLSVGSALAAEGASPGDAQTRAEDLSGIYRCEGRNYGGQPYQGTVTIRKAGSAYQFHWSIGNLMYYGIALREGDVVSASWTTGPGVPGIVVYKVGPGRRLVGVFSDYGAAGRLGDEVLTFLATEGEPAAPHAPSLHEGQEA